MSDPRGKTPPEQRRPASWEFASEAHAGQRRGTTLDDFIDHPRRVATLVSEAGGDDALVDAALLHDVVEDTDVGLDAIREEFGDEVAGLVAVLSDDPSIEDYSARKDALRAQVRAGGARPALIYAADKLDNSRDLRRAHAEIGAAVRERIKVSFTERIRIWRDDLLMTRELLGDTDLVRALERELDTLEAALRGSPSESII